MTPVQKNMEVVVLYKEDLLREKIEHVDIKKFDASAIIDYYGGMSFQARNLSRAARIYDGMLSDNNCTIILCMAGSLFSSGLKKAVHDLIMNNMVDAIVSTGALIVDQDFFEALGFSHYKGACGTNDGDLQKCQVDRIYDTYISEEELRICDMTIAKIADSLPPGPYSSREFIRHMGRHIEKSGTNPESVVLAAHKKGVPIFVPAFSDCSAGFGLVYHQWHRNPDSRVTIDSAKDFLELTKVKIASRDTGLLMIGGGVPKNFAQDIVVAADILGIEVPMHKYAIQVTVADERDGGLSGSTLQEAHSWGKLGQGHEQMVFSEATLAMPLILSNAYHRGNWKARPEKRWADMLDRESAPQLVGAGC